MLNIAICDDSKIFSNDLAEKLNIYFSSKSQNINIQIFNSSQDFFNFLTKQMFDLLFLDIEIDKNSGIDIAKFIRSTESFEHINIIFISAYKNYALDLFRLRPIDFLIKPINKDKLFNVLDLFISLKEKESYIFKYKIKSSLNMIDCRKIIFFESFGRKVRIVTQSNEDIFYGNLKSIGKELENFNFVQTHNSFLVNSKYITKIGNSELVLKNNIRIPISRSNKEKILKMFMES